MTFSIFGLPVSPGIAIGRAQLVSHATLEVPQYQLRERDVAAEQVRLGAAFAAVKADFEALREEATAPGSPAELEAFLASHRAARELYPALAAWFVDRLASASTSASHARTTPTTQTAPARA